MATIDVKSGVTSSGLNLSSATLNVSSGGTIVQTTLNGGAVANLYAGAQGSETNLNGGAQFRVYSNAIVQTISAGTGATLVIYAGGTVSGASLDSAAAIHLTLDGKTNVAGSYVGGGTFSVSGGTASGLLIGSDCSFTNYTAGCSAVNLQQTGNGKLNFNVAGKTTTYIQGTHQSGSFLLSGGVASGFLLNCGVVQNVSAGGVASATILYGDQYVSGGTVIDTELYGNQLLGTGAKAQCANVHSGGKIIVVFGSASGVTLEQGGTLVLTDGVATDVNVASGGIVQVAVGNSSNVVSGTVGAKSFSLSNNIASGFTLYAGGCLDVSSGTVLDAVVSSGGSVILSAGLVKDTTVFKGGSVSLSAGVAQDTTVSSGGRLMLSGGYAENTIVGKNGLQGVSAGALAVHTVANGSQFVYAGGSASDTTLLSGGRLSCAVAASVADVTIGSGARMFVSGTASDVFICSGGSAFVYNQAVLNGSNVLSGGALTYSGGAVLRGTLDVYGGLAVFNGNNNASGAVINLDLSGIQALGMVPLLKGYDNLTGDFSLNAKLSAGQVGNYYVASSATTLTSLDAVIDGAVAALQAGSTFVDYANNTEYSLTGATGYVYVSGAVASSGLEEVSGAAAMQTVNGSDKGAKWGNATTFTSGSFYAGSGTGNNVWLQVNTANSAFDTILYGGAGGADVSGKISLEIEKGSFKAIMGGMATAANSAGAVAISLADGSAGVIYGGGFGSVDGDIGIAVNSGASVTGQIYGGPMVNSPSCNVYVGGTTSLALNDGTLGSDAIGGARVFVNNTNTTAVGAISVDVAGTSFTGGAGKCIYGAGWVVGNGSVRGDDNYDYVTGDVTVNVTGNVEIGRQNGRGIFGGAFVSANARAEVAGDVSITISGCTVGNVYGGGWAQSGAKSDVTGSVTIDVTGGTVGRIYGGGSHGANATAIGNTNIAGNVTIRVTDSTVEAITAVGQASGDTITGNADVIIAGASDIKGVFGTGYQGVVGAAGTTLTLDGFTGIIRECLSGFDGITVDKDSTAVFASEAEISGAQWTFDLAGRKAADIALTWSNGRFDTASFDLNLGETATEWTVCDLSGDDVATKVEAFGEVTFNLNVGGTIVAGYALGNNIGVGAWDSWKLDYDEDTGKLAFGQITIA